MICIQCVSEHTIQCNVQCVLHSPNSITVVSASFRWTSSDLPRWYSHFGEPPNLVAWVRPGHILQAVRVWPKHGRVPSGRVSWGEGRQLTDGFKFNSWYMLWANHNIVCLHVLYRIWPDMAEHDQLKSLGSSLNDFGSQHTNFGWLLLRRLSHFPYSQNKFVSFCLLNKSENTPNYRKLV